MPKAHAFGDEDDEKTTIESGWEEEASTTVEQGEVAEKIRALGIEGQRPRHNNTNITNTNGGMVDEPTVDDQRANAALSLITPASLAARLVITQGNDAGQEIEVRPGKSYTIGRGIDNDFVLTDIAVSRKHFDLRHEDGAWVLADRGSGNGTIVNGNIEDQPFMLANGDVIEIGNTTFRFDHAGATRTAATFDMDEEEPSTVAGKPMRSEEVSTPPSRPPPAVSPRPKTVPPPAPRMRAPSSAPAIGYPLGAQGSVPPVAAPLPPLQMKSQPMPLPAAALPLPQQMPQHLAQQVPQHMPLPNNHHGHANHNNHAHNHSNGNRAPLGSPAPAMLGGDMIRPQMLGAHEGMQPLPGMMPSTIPGQGMPMTPAHPQAMPYGYPVASVAELQKQHAHMLVVNGGMPRDATSTALVPPTPYGAGMMPMSMPPAYGTQARSSSLSRRTKLMLGGVALTVFAAIATVAIIKSSSGTSSSSASPVTKPTVESIDDGTQAAEPKVATPVPEPAKVEPIEIEPPKIEPKPEAKPEPPKVAVVEPPKTEPKPEPKVEPKPEPKVEPKPEPKTVTRNKPRPAPKPRNQPRQRNRPDRDPPPKRVSAVDASEVRAKVDALYRARKFNEAAAALKSAGKAIGGRDGNQLLSDSAVYKQFGQLFNRGMGPATKSTDAFAALRRAEGFDSSIGRAYIGEIKKRLETVAPRAAIAYLANKDYDKAFDAMRVAEDLGASNASTKVVRKNLESRAGDLYAAAAKEIDSDPDAARAKLKQIKTMVDAKSRWFQKANKLLASS